MCGGMVGEAIHGVDKGLNFLDPALKPTQKLTADIFGGNTLPTKWFDKITNHPLESAAAATTLWSSLGAFGFGGALGEGAAAGAGAGAGAGAAGGAGLGAEAGVDAGATNLFADGVVGTGDVGATASGMAGAGAETAGIGAASDSGGSWLSSLFGGGGSSGGSGIGFNAATAKNGLGLAQILSSLYGMEQSHKLSKAASSQSLSNAGLQAVQRSMAAQGYQGSGNMATALSKYGADAYSANLAQQQQSLSNTMGGLGLLTAGVGNLAGWGTTAGGKP